MGTNQPGGLVFCFELVAQIIQSLFFKLLSHGNRVLFAKFRNFSLVAKSLIGITTEGT